MHSQGNHFNLTKEAGMLWGTDIPVFAIYLKL